MNIVIRATNWIGDAVMSLPALRAVRARFPEAQISVLARPWVAALYEGERSIDRVIPFETRWRAIRNLRAVDFDLGILLPNSFDSAAVLRLGGVRHIIGYARDGRGLLLTRSIPLPRPNEIPSHERFYYLELLRRAELIDSLPEVPEIRFDGIGEEAAARAGRFRHGRYFPAGRRSQPRGGYGSAKRWVPERFAEAASRLASDIGGSVAVFGSAAEKALCATVARSPTGVRNPQFRRGDQSPRVHRMAAACSIFLTNDSGAMHIAAARPCLGDHLRADRRERHRPSGRSAPSLRHPVECAPCLRRECPIDHRCMTRVTVEDVLLAAPIHRRRIDRLQLCR